MCQRLGFYALLTTLVVATGTANTSCVLGADTEQNKIDLIVDGQSTHTIIVAPDAALPVKFAAFELQKYLQQISGACLPITSDASRSLAICLGGFGVPKDEIRKLQAALKDRGEDGYAMRTAGPRIVLAGNSPRATLYAVYHFLEKYLGCGWCIPGDDTVPKKTTVRLDPFDDAVGPPAFKMRKIVLFPYGSNGVYVGDSMKTRNIPHTDWMAKNRFNWAHPGPNGPGNWEKDRSRELLVPEVEKRGLYLEVGGHTFNTFLPIALYGKTHPEYYALKKDGTRANNATKHNWISVCLSHPGVAKQMAENISDWLDENPEVDIVDLWHDDSKDYCHCPKCTLASEGSSKAETQAAYAKSYVRFTNQVAALVARRHPKVLLNALMYKQTLDCPDDAPKFSDNVMVGVALYPRWIQKKMRPLETSPQAIDMNLRKQFSAWKRLSKHFYLYEYYTFTDGEKFWSMASMIRDDLRFFRRCGVDGISSDQHIAGKWFFLNMYAFARLAWNPDMEVEEIIADFCDRFYGEASEPMNEYWDLLEEGLRESWQSDKPTDWRDKKRVVLIRKALVDTKNPKVKRRIRATAVMHHLKVGK